MTETLQEAVDRLVGMGSVKRVAEYLRENGYFEGATSCNAYNCPLGKYLTDKVGAPVGIAPETGIRVSRVGNQEMPTPFILKQFIYRYDGCLGFDDL